MKTLAFLRRTLTCLLILAMIGGGAAFHPGGVQVVQADPPPSPPVGSIVTSQSPYPAFIELIDSIILTVSASIQGLDPGDPVPTINYSWSVTSSGSVSGSGSSVTFSSATPGPFTITCTVSAAGLSSVDVTFNITVNPLPALPEFELVVGDITGPSSVNHGQSFTLSLNPEIVRVPGSGTGGTPPSISSISWTSGLGSASGSNPSFTGHNTGTSPEVITFTATVTAPGAINSPAITLPFTVTVQPEPPPVSITITSHPQSVTVTRAAITGNLSVVATAPPGTTLSYQWFSNTSASNTGGAPISGATGTSFTIPTTLTATTHYFVEVSATGVPGAQ